MGWRIVRMSFEETSFTPSLSLSGVAVGDIVSVLTIGSLLSVLFMFFVASSSESSPPPPPPRAGLYDYDFYNDGVEFYEPSVESLLTSHDIHDLYRAFQ